MFRVEAGKKMAKPTELQDRTDYSRWRLLDEAGRHTWHYLEDDEAAEKWPQSLADKYFLGLPLVLCFIAAIMDYC